MNSQLLLRFTPEIKSRLDTISKRTGAYMTELVRLATIEHIEQWERRFHEYEQRQNSEAVVRRTNKRTFGSSELGPKNRPVEAEVQQSEAKEEPDHLYLDHASKIAEVKDSPFEKQLRMLEAIREIRQKFPLSHPSEPAIREKLETLMSRQSNPISLPIDSQLVAIATRLLELLTPISGEPHERKDSETDLDSHATHGQGDRSSYGAISSGFSNRDGRTGTKGSG